MTDDDSCLVTPVDLGSVWATLAEQHYTLTDDQVIGLPNNLRGNVLQRYFNDETLRHDEGDWPIDRKRARDVVEYEWRDGLLHLREYDRITITDRAGIAGEREHARVRLLKDPDTREIVRTFLCLIPPGRRRRHGTFGVNLFRTLTDVVSKPHDDDEEFVILYVLDRVGDGAESYLYDPRDVTTDGQTTAGPVFKHQLSPGEIFIFEDKLFKHGATPLEPPDGTARRDVLVCTVDYRSTYLGEETPLSDEDVLVGSRALSNGRLTP